MAAKNSNTLQGTLYDVDLVQTRKIRLVLLDEVTGQEFKFARYSDAEQFLSLVVPSDIVG